jgi:hypothetical protein
MQRCAEPGIGERRGFQSRAPCACERTPFDSRLRPTVLDEFGSESWAVPRRLSALPPQRRAAVTPRAGHGSPALHRPRSTLSPAVDPPDEEASQVSKKKLRRRPKKKRGASAAPLPAAAG